MPPCPRCGGWLYLDTEDADGERYWRCINCARAYGVKARSQRRESANVYGRRGGRG